MALRCVLPIIGKKCLEKVKQCSVLFLIQYGRDNITIKVNIVLTKINITAVNRCGPVSVIQAPCIILHTVCNYRTKIVTRVTSWQLLKCQSF